MRDPVLELFGGFELAPENQCVQSRFVDDDEILYPVGGRDSRLPLVLVVNVSGESVTRICVAQRGCDVFADEPRLTVDDDDADLPKLLVLEELNVCVFHDGNLLDFFARG